MMRMVLVFLCVMVMWWDFLWTLVTSSQNVPIWGFMMIKLAARGCESWISALNNNEWLTSWNMMKFLISSLTRFWYWTWMRHKIIAGTFDFRLKYVSPTWSLSVGMGTRVGPKQMAMLYGSIMFSSLQLVKWESLFVDYNEANLDPERWLRKAKR